MIELAQHIETLLLENDCVILPGLGGFIAHYNPAYRVTDENLFMPPTRTIGFNPQLKINDGLLVQSYMTAYDTNYSDATRRVERQVERLSDTLHEEGKAELPNIGELSYSIHGTYDFTPYDNRLTTPALYGLDCFEMQELGKAEADKTQPDAPVDKPQEGTLPQESDRKVPAKIIPYKTIASIAAAVAVLLAFIFFISAPVENTRLMKDNFARLLPDGLFEQADKPSAQKRKKTVKPVAVKEVKVPKTEAQTPTEAKPDPVVAQPKAQPAEPAQALSYHIIVASVGTERDAEAFAKQLVEKGYANAHAIIGDGKRRVCIQSFATETEAYRALAQIRETVTEQAWVLKK